jgi:hypothetical protein
MLPPYYFMQAAQGGDQNYGNQKDTEQGMGVLCGCSWASVLQQAMFAVQA